jgi:predicted ribosome quality control (RQC) complex YloA/Tae2 family protein
MNFDVFTTAAVVDELSRILERGRVQDTLEIGNDAVGLEIYATHERHYLLISAHAQEARIHLVTDRVRRGVENPSPLGLMLRRYLEGAWLSAIRQPAWERIVHLEFDSPDGVFTLIAETMERRSNVLLVREGQIMDCLRRVGPQENRVRVSLPGYEYVPPPPQKMKRPPDQMTLDLLKNALDADPGKAAWRTLTDSVLGFSPMLAKETVYRAMEQTNIKAGDTSARALFAAMNELLAPLLERRWQPGITESDGLITSYATYPVTHLPGWRATETISEALARITVRLWGSKRTTLPRSRSRRRWTKPKIGFSGGLMPCSALSATNRNANG